MSIGSFLKDKLKNMASKSGSFGAGISNPPEYQFGDRLSTDKRLIALRRLRNKQLDEIERRELDRKIKAYQRKEASKGFLGDNPILTNPKGKKRAKKGVKQAYIKGSCGFMGKGRL